MMNPISFCFSKNIFIPPSCLKNCSPDVESQVSSYFPFRDLKALKMAFHCHWLPLVFFRKSGVSLVAPIRIM